MKIEESAESQLTEACASKNTNKISKTTNYNNPTGEMEWLFRKLVHEWPPKIKIEETA